MIGHDESLSSPYHREDVPALRTQTHSDFVHRDMQTYRAPPAAAGRLLMAAENVARVGVVGAGFMGSGIAESAASAGNRRHRLRARGSAAQALAGAAGGSVERAVSRGKLTARGC